VALPEQPSAYEDCYDYYERAKASPKGIRVLFDNERDAGMFRMRMNMARVIQRREAMRIYARTDPAYGKSEFDSLKCAVRPTAELDGRFWVYIEPWKSDNLGFEELE